MIQLSERAVSKVKELLTTDNKTGYGLRVAVQGGGCSGFQYGLTFDNEEKPNDNVLEIDGLKVYNARLQRQIDNQTVRIGEIDESIDQVTVISRQMTPLAIRNRRPQGLRRCDVRNVPRRRQDRLHREP